MGLKKARRFLLGCFGGGTDENLEDVSIDDLRDPDNHAYLRQQKFATRGYRYVCDDGEVVYLRNPPITIPVSVHSQGTLEDEANSSGIRTNTEDEDMIENNREMFWESWGPKIEADALGDEKSSFGSSSEIAFESGTVEGPLPDDSAGAHGANNFGHHANQPIVPPEKSGSGDTGVIRIDGESIENDDVDEATTMPSRCKINGHDSERTKANGSPPVTGISEDHLAQLMFSPRRDPQVARGRSQSPPSLNLDLNNSARYAVVKEHKDGERHNLSSRHIVRDNYRNTNN